ncbi:MAG TPA: thioredoxin domain-containing protein [Candidatus Dojkabacteria bacterium]|nr:thioredoxin domain-containing protein [Candidatus Dojkabacteria bacterium]
MKKQAKLAQKKIKETGSTKMVKSVKSSAKKVTKSTGPKREVERGIEVNLTPFLTPAAILMGSLMISLSFIFGVRSASQNSLEASLVCDSSSPLSRDCLVKYAKDLGLDSGRFAACVDNGDFKQTVADEITAGNNLNVQGTPTMYIGKGSGTQIKALYIGTGAAYKEFASLIEYAGANSIEAIQEYWLNVQLDQLESFRDRVKEYFASSDGGSYTGDELEKQTNEYMATQRQVIEQDNVVQDVDLGNGVASGTGEVVLVEFSDYECPYCRQFATSILKDIKTNYVDSGKLKYVFRDYPLEEIHVNARLAAEAVRCAGDQNRYFEYHDKVFASQDTQAAQ